MFYPSDVENCYGWQIQFADGNPLMQEIRYLDKLVDELAKGKKMENIIENTASAVRNDCNISRG